MKKNLVIAILILGLAGAVSGALVNARRAAAYRAQLEAPPVEFINHSSSHKGNYPPPASTPRSTNDTAQGSTETDELRSRIAYLEDIVAQREAEIRNLQQAPPPPPAQTRATTPRPNPQEWLENLKKENPQQYEELVKRREEARQAVQNSFAEKAAYFLDRDQSNRTPEEKEQYARMLEMLDQTWKIAEMSRADLPQDERRNLMRTVRHNMVELEPMLESEREKEWQALGTRLGYDEKGAKELATYLNEVIELTSMRDIYQNMRAGTYGHFHGTGGGTNAPAPQ